MIRTILQRFKRIKSGIKGIKKEEETTNYPNRFLKFYYLNKKRLIRERRYLYKKKKKSGLCVRCSQKVFPGIIFCGYHQEKQKEYNRKARSSN